MSPMGIEKKQEYIIKNKEKEKRILLDKTFFRRRNQVVSYM